MYEHHLKRFEQKLGVPSIYVCMDIFLYSYTRYWMHNAEKLEFPFFSSTKNSVFWNCSCVLGRSQRTPYTNKISATRGSFLWVSTTE